MEALSDSCVNDGVVHSVQPWRQRSLNSTSVLFFTVHETMRRAQWTSWRLWLTAVWKNQRMIECAAWSHGWARFRRWKAVGWCGVGWGFILVYTAAFRLIRELSMLTSLLNHSVCLWNAAPIVWQMALELLSPITSPVWSPAECGHRSRNYRCLATPGDPWSYVMQERVQ